MRYEFRFMFFALTLVLLVSACLEAQEITGNITGTVSDSTGAFIVAATVTANNTRTGAARTTRVDATSRAKPVERRDAPAD